MQHFEQILQSPDRARRFTRMLYEIHIPLAEEVANALDLSGVERLMDLGGGSGVVSLALLQRYPQLTATVVDIANVCSAGREIAAEHPMADRITYLAMDYLHDELPSGFDLVLLCDAGPLKAELFRKIRMALNPAGHLVIIDHYAPKRGVAPSAWLYWAFLASLANPTFTLPTVMEVQSQLKEANFQILSVRTLPESEVRRWSTDWIMLEASN
jgi:cyclopropane fatty-acyl-phospholipid synthase-like methyltransferase